MGRPAVAIIGASGDRRKFGNKAVRAYIDAGWDVYPINPRGGQIEGRPAQRSLEEVPVPLKRVSLYLPPEAGIAVLPAIAAAGADELFINPGAESPELLEEARRLGLEPIEACSIVAIGKSPRQYPDE